MSGAGEGEGPAIRTTARTDPRAADPRLRGRTYAISFDRVWHAACELAGGGLGRWRLLHFDDEEGVIEAEATTLVFRLRDAVHVEVGLDENAQTRVDVEVSSLKAWADAGRGRRLVGRFFRRLDVHLGAGPAQILDATRSPEWSA